MLDLLLSGALGAVCTAGAGSWWTTGLIALLSSSLLGLLCGLSCCIGCAAGFYLRRPFWPSPAAVAAAAPPVVAQAVTVGRAVAATYFRSRTGGPAGLAAGPRARGQAALAGGQAWEALQQYRSRVG